ncbi:MAG: FAD-binding oxidoreductase [Acidobacteria bacterium]|nr:FAD-binding oxidoreductase [Acidobacteriota bacterium]
MMNRRRFLQAISAGAMAVPLRSLWAAGGDRVVVVGAGILGSSIAYHLAKRGAKVTVLEKKAPASGTTADSFAYINASHKQPRPYYELNHLGIQAWRRLQQELGPELQVQWGGAVEWRAAGEGSEKLLTTLHQYQQWGYDAWQIDEEDLHRLAPQVSPGPVGAAAFYKEDAAVDPVQAVNLLLRKAREFGATVDYPVEVTGLDLADGRLRALQTTRGRIEADLFILAAGIGTPPLAKGAGAEVPLSTSTGVLAHTAPLPALLDRVVFAPGASIRQNSDGSIITSGTFEGKTQEFPNDKSQGQALLENAARFVPKLRGVQVARVTTGSRVLPKDGFPILGFDENVRNLYIAATHSGVTLAPVIGQFVSLEVLDRISVDVLQPYRPARFARG